MFLGLASHKKHPVCILQSIGVHRSISSLAHSPFLPAHFLFPLTQSSPASNKSIHFLPRSRSRPLHSLPPSSHTLPRKLTQTTGNIAPILPSGGHGDGHINSQAAHGGANHLYEGKWENSLFHCKNYNLLASAFGSLFLLGSWNVGSSLLRAFSYHCRFSECPNETSSPSPQQ